MLFMRMIVLGATGVVLAVATAATAAIQPPQPGEASPAFERLDQNQDGVLDEAEFGKGLKHLRKQIQKARRMGSDGPRGKRADREAGNQPRQDGQGMGRRLRAMVTRIVKQELRKQRQGMGRGMGRDMQHPPRKGAQWARKHQGNRKAGRYGPAGKGPWADRDARRERGPRGNQFAGQMGFDGQGKQGRQDRRAGQDRYGWQERQGRQGRGQGGPAFAPPEGHRKDVRYDRRMMKHGPKGQRAGRGGRGGRADRGDRGERGNRWGRHHADDKGPRDGFLPRLDQNRDGVITPDEFQVDPRKLKRLFYRMLDLNGDGAIDRMEAERLMKHIKGGPQGDRRGRR